MFVALGVATTVGKATALTQTATFKCGTEVKTCPLYYAENGIGYTCSLRAPVASCASSPASAPEATTRGECMLRCHMDSRCGSYAWDPEDTLCRLCGAELNEDPVEATLSLRDPDPESARSAHRAQTQTQTQTNPAILMLAHAVVYGKLSRFEVEGIDYVSQKYVNTAAQGPGLRGIVVPSSTRSLHIVFEGPFCVVEPFLRHPDEDLVRVPLNGNLARFRSGWKTSPLAAVLILMGTAITLIAAVRLRTHKKAKNLIASLEQPCLAAAVAVTSTVAQGTPKQN